MNLGLLSVALHSALPLGAGTDDRIDFDRDVLPILSDHCFHCHGPDAGTREADLRLDVHDDVLFVAEPGEPEISDLMHRVLHKSARQVMPPPDYEKPLNADQIEILRRWIEEGVVWESHWAYTPIEAHTPALIGDVHPAVSGIERFNGSSDALDTYVVVGLATQGLAPAPPADPATWLRRVSLDLVGLPPSVEDLAAFEAAMRGATGFEDEQLARAAVVDQLLASPRHAEHRTREWLDIARYADTNGYQNDFRRDQWPWRDWVLRSFQSNMPYDRFVQEQIAGDLLEDATLQTTLGTGFQRNHRTVTEAGSIDEEWRVENVADRAETTATAFMGLTLACARCHDHKYDALTQKDYYRFYGFFDSIDEKGVYEETRGNVAPLVHLPTDEQLARLEELKGIQAQATEALAAAERGAATRYRDWCAGASAQPAPGVPAALTERTGTMALGEGDARHKSHSFGTDVTFQRDAAFTVSAWVKPESSGAVYSRMNEDSTYRGTDLVLLGSMQPAVHLIHSWPGRAIKVVGATKLERGQWHHLAVTYDGSSSAAGVGIWLNGEAVELKTEADSLDGTISSEAPLLVGFRHNAGDLAGEVADFRVDGSALSTGQIVGLALARATGEGGLPFYLGAFDGEVRRARVARADAVAEHERIEQREIATAMVLRDRAEPRVTKLLDRGSYDRPIGEPLQPDIPEVFGGLGESGRHDRLGLAEWLTSEQNPLTARVAVNRVWASFFGQGLVATQDDFGVRGDRPTQPELLDFLAAEFMASGWDLRALERRIVLSATYGQSSAVDAAALEKDPKNQWLARGPRHRLDAETIRDQALAVSGLLVERVGGPSVKPYQPDGLWKELAGGAGQGAYVPSSGDGLFRRSLYTYRKRTVPHPTLSTFDAPGFELCSVSRSRTNTPLQALATLNDTTYIEAARHLAKRMMASAEVAPGRLAFGARVLLARELRAEETAVLTGALERYLADFGADATAREELLGVGATAPPVPERTAEWAAYTMIASTLLNLDEALIKR